MGMKDELPKPGFLVIGDPLTEDIQDMNINEQTGFNYVCGYFIKKLLTKHNCTHCKLEIIKANNITSIENSFIAHKQYKDLKFGLIVPADEFVSYIQKLEHILQENFSKFMFDKNVGLNLY